MDRRRGLQDVPPKGIQQVQQTHDLMGLLRAELRGDLIGAEDGWFPRDDVEDRPSPVLFSLHAISLMMHGDFRLDGRERTGLPVGSLRTQTENLSLVVNPWRPRGFRL